MTHVKEISLPNWCIYLLFIAPELPQTILATKRTKCLLFSTKTKVSKQQSNGGLFLLNRIWELGWFRLGGQFTVCEFLVFLRIKIFLFSSVHWDKITPKSWQKHQFLVKIYQVTPPKEFLPKYPPKKSSQKNPPKKNPPKKILTKNFS